MRLVLPHPVEILLVDDLSVIQDEECIGAGLLEPLSDGRLTVSRDKFATNRAD